MRGPLSLSGDPDADMNKENRMRNTEVGKLCQYVPIYISADWLGTWTVERAGIVIGTFRTQFQARQYVRQQYGKMAEQMVHIHAVQPSHG
jgi:hypothetical protein